MHRSVFFVLVSLAASLVASGCKQAPVASQSSTVQLEADGSVHMPAQVVPPSEFLSPEAKAYVAEHLRQMQDPEMVKQDAGVPHFMKPMLERARAQFALDREDKKIAGVHVYDYSPKAGVAEANRKRVLINLHGGGFSGCWPACAELESMPIAAGMGIRVVAVDYRESPEAKFPAASEDVAAVYRELLKSYKPGAIGVYGCSAGGMLTAMSLAWFQAHDLPRPGAAGIFCASAGSFGGDATATANPLGEARMAMPGAGGGIKLGYLAGADPKSPLVSPIQSTEVLKKFPPTLLVTGDRDFAVSGAEYTEIQLASQGVETELHVWDGLFHGFFYNSDIPESKQAFQIIGRFFDRHLGR